MRNSEHSKVPYWCCPGPQHSMTCLHYPTLGHDREWVSLLLQSGNMHSSIGKVHLQMTQCIDDTPLASMNTPA